MTIRKSLAAATMAVALFTAPAFAAPQQIVAATPSTPTPWAGIAFSAGAVSVILNGAIVSATQCRELTAQEAYTSILLPFVGIAFNSNASLCGKKKK